MGFDEGQQEWVLGKICMNCEQAWRVIHVRDNGCMPPECREVTACQASDKVNPNILEDREKLYFNGEKGEWYILFRDSYSEDLRGGDRRVVIEDKTYYALTQTESASFHRPALARAIRRGRTSSRR